MGVFSCHQAVRREAFFASGGFNPENTAGEWIGDGETGLNMKIFALNGLFAYTDQSRIHHMIPATRMTQKYLNKRLTNQGNCDSYTFYRGTRLLRRKLLFRLPIFIVKGFASGIAALVLFITANSFFRVKVAYIFYYISRFRYDLRLIHDAGWREMVLKENWLEE